MKKFAWIVSRVFEPAWELPAILVMSVYFSVDELARGLMISVLLFLDVFIPMVFALLRAKKGKLTDIDVTSREERKALYLFIVSCHLLGVLSAFFFEQFVLGRVLLVLWVISLFFMIINQRWKISVHAGVNALMMVLLNNFWGWRMFGWMMVLLIMVLWSRVYLRKHTLTQVMVGAGLAILIAETGFRVLGI